MENTESTPSEKRSSISVSYFIIGLVIILFVFFSVTGYVLFIEKSSSPKTVSQKKDILPPDVSPTTQPSLLLPINPDNSGVISAGAFYTLVGRINTIAKSGDNYLMSINSQTGERIIDDLMVKEVDLNQVGVLDDKTKAVTKLPLSSFVKDDLIQLDITVSFKSKIYQVTSI